MGPQLCSCGNRVVGQDGHHPSGGFNGAATLQLRKRDSPYPGRREPECFNGAATLQLRKQEAGVIVTSYTEQLQWGRNFAVAETECLLV